MFSSSQKHTAPDTASPFRIEGNPSSSGSAEGATVIARGVKLEGDFSSKGDVVIEGEVNGKVTASGKLTVGSEAVIRADITADAAVISGLVEGNVTVKGQAVLHATARLTGDLTAERIMVESGATLVGQVHIGPKGAVTQKPDTAPEEKKEG
jgi:cytoskeletal protein CcmA (bactofilin family)